MSVTIARPHSLRGEIVSPGDKSVSHRAVIFNALSKTNTARITNFSPGADCSSTQQIMQSLGVEITREPGGQMTGDSLTVKGVGLEGLVEPDDILDAGNSGTTTRLMAGILAGQNFLSVAPLVFHGGSLQGIKYDMPVASAQLKSCLLLAGLRADGITNLSQPAESRDHTERMLSAMGANLKKEGLDLILQPSELETIDVEVPGDISSAAFWMIAAACHPDAELLIRNVGVNPTRSGIITALHMMKARLELMDEREVAGEPVADVLVRTSDLQGIELSGETVPLLIDEIPVIAVAAAVANGETVIKDAQELRVKESDRIESSISWLRKAGINAEGTTDGMIIAGNEKINGGSFQSYDDHRLAMSLGIAGLISERPITIADPDVAAISYPGFWGTIKELGGLVA